MPLPRVLLCLLMLLASLPARADEAVWKLLRQGGQVVFIRHAVTTPGVGDPEGFRLDDCSTQRNLSEAGKAEARRLGESLRTRNVPIAQVLSSPWCRTVETARLATGREPTLEKGLSNLFGKHENEQAQIARLKVVTGRAPQGGNLLLFTHGSTTMAFTGQSPATAEMVVMTPQPGGGLKFAGRIPVAP